jgi:hypothetical protein
MTRFKNRPRLNRHIVKQIYAVHTFNARWPEFSPPLNDVGTLELFAK